MTTSIFGDLGPYAVRLFLDWLNGRYGRSFVAKARGGDSEGPDAECYDGDDSVAVVVAELSEPESDPPWASRRGAVERLLRDGAGGGAYVLWAPPGADLPGDEPALSAFALRVRETAERLAPGERGEVEFPVVLTLRKLEDDGGYINVLGGMSHLWAEFTGRVSGVYRLDSLAVHRLPADADRRRRLSEAIVAAAGEVQLVGESVGIDTVDAWTLQRLPGDAPAGFAVAASPPSPATDPGVAVRRSLRRLLKRSQLRLGGASLKGRYRGLALIGVYADERSENVSTAMRGFDPTIFAAIDFIVLLVDGAVRPIYVSPRVRL